MWVSVQIQPLFSCKSYFTLSQGAKNNVKQLDVLYSHDWEYRVIEEELLDLKFNISSSFIYNQIILYGVYKNCVRVEVLTALVMESSVF